LGEEQEEIPKARVAAVKASNERDIEDEFSSRLGLVASRQSVGPSALQAFPDLRIDGVGRNRSLESPGCFNRCTQFLKELDARRAVRDMSLDRRAVFSGQFSVQIFGEPGEDLETERVFAAAVLVIVSVWMTAHFTST
jgi:hypothetical protein